MKAKGKLAFVCALCILFGVRHATAAVTCVENKATGKFEEKTASKRPTGECEAQASMNRMSSVSEVDDLSVAEGTKVIGGVIVTNAPRPFDPAPTMVPQGAAANQRLEWTPLAGRSETAGQPVRPLASDSQGAALAVKQTSVPMTATQEWEMKAGQSLRVALDAWCERAGYRLVWKVDGGFRSQGDFLSESEFRQAVKDLFAAIPQDLHLDVEITKNKLVIISQGSK